MTKWRRRAEVVREFKIYDATVAKTSLKIASLSLSIFFINMSICLTFESQRNYPGTEFSVCAAVCSRSL